MTDLMLRNNQAARVCQGIMSTATLVGLLAFLLGAVLGRIGVQSMFVALLVLDCWLAWPIGALCCVIAAWYVGKRPGGHPAQV